MVLDFFVCQRIESVTNYRVKNSSGLERCQYIKFLPFMHLRTIGSWAPRMVLPELGRSEPWEQSQKSGLSTARCGPETFKNLVVVLFVILIWGNTNIHRPYSWHAQGTVWCQGLNIFIIHIGCLSSRPLWHWLIDSDFLICSSLKSILMRIFFMSLLIICIFYQWLLELIPLEFVVSHIWLFSEIAPVSVIRDHLVGS